MTESIATRVSRIISGGLNALVDAVENVAPEIVMEQAIREMGTVIDEVRHELGLTAANKHLASTRFQEENHKHAKLAEQISVAVQQERDDLAAAAVAQQLDIEAQFPILERTLADCVTREKELESYITALQGKRREMQEELARYTAARQQAQSSEQGATAIARTLETKVEKAGSAFDRILEKATGMPGRRSPPDIAIAAQLAELEELSRKHRIQERLAAIKAEIKG
ncbi:MAG: PspA/IM30 family protein [Gammaproteobacteria bacterium]|nr:PspA/IM30 family protein [Gammaproteobacteria bacterium]